jgi:hypothetical protein
MTMTNYSVFNKSNDPLYTQLTNTYLIPAIGNTPEGDAAKSSVLYVVSSGSVAVAGGNSLLMQIANPSGSGKTLYVSSIKGGVTAAVTLAVFKGGTITGGTTPTPVNANFGSSNASVVLTARYNNTGTLGGSPTGMMAIPLTAGMFELYFGGSVVIPPNQTLSITIGTAAATSSAVFTWWEY